MKIKFLGTGGFINNGIPYNSFVLNDVHLIECPPDIMISLQNNGINFLQIETIFISHFHGDHYFGMPFFILNLLNKYTESDKPLNKITLISQKGVRNYLTELQKIAVTPDNPSVTQIDDIFNFIEIDLSSRIKLNNSNEMIFHKMTHTKNTYGFSILDNGKYKLTYLADTVWDDSFNKILSNKPQCIICDVNSSSSDKIKAHMSESDILEKAMSITGDATKYIGTHVRDNSSTDKKNLIYAQQGSEYYI